MGVFPKYGAQDEAEAQSGPAWRHSGPECPHHAGINHINQPVQVIFMELNKVWEGEGFYTQHSEMGVILQVGVRSFSCLRNRHNRKKKVEQDSWVYWSLLYSLPSQSCNFYLSLLLFGLIFLWIVTISIIHCNPFHSP